jgi:hypothetical protein
MKPNARSRPADLRLEHDLYDNLRAKAIALNVPCATLMKRYLREGLAREAPPPDQPPPTQPSPGASKPASAPRSKDDELAELLDQTDWDAIDPRDDST